MQEIKKRDSSIQIFDNTKIKKAILKAFKECNIIPSKADIEKIDTFLETLYGNLKDHTVEEIQNIVETFLCSNWFEVGKVYMLYREKHKELRLYSEKMQYINNYLISSKAAADLSNTDANANTTIKNAVTLEGELYKDNNRKLIRRQMKALLEEIQSPYRDQYLGDIEHRIIYAHDEATSPILKPYCSAYTLYPLLLDGTSTLDGTSNHAPQHLSSFVGQFQNLIFLLSAQKKGAGAYGDFFNFFSYFCEKEWGKNYYLKEDVIISNDSCLRKETIGSAINQYFQSLTYYMNQPAGNRGFQCPFTNFNIFDSYYWKAMFEDFVFPDGSKPNWEAVSWLQKRYMKWLNEERTKTLLTFPVISVCLLTDGKDIVDKEYKDLVTTQWAEGDSFFTYMSQNADSVASCCRLRNEVTDNTFSSTTGLTGVQTGSCNVITLNLNRIVQDWYNNTNHPLEALDPHPSRLKFIKTEEAKNSLKEYLRNILLRVYSYHKAYKTGLYKMAKLGMFTQTKAGYISFDRLYCTIGVNGINEAGLFFGMKVSNNADYMNFCTMLLSTINNYNKEHSEKKFKYNLEIVPAESLGIKNYNWDKKEGYEVPIDRNLYNSYIYDAHDDTTILDKIAMQGGEVAKSISGGQASHINLKDNLDKEQYTKLLEYAVSVGNNYLTFNVPQTQCKDCNFIAKHPLKACPKCGGTNLSYWTRIIGYLTPMDSWSAERREEGLHRTFTEPSKAIKE